MTNKEAMCLLPDAQFFAKIEWLLHDYGRNYTDTRLAVIDWLGQEAKRGNECETICRYAPPGKKWPCVDCDMRVHDRAEPPKEEKT